MLSLAFGPLNITPEIFWSLTWADYYRMLDGYLAREFSEWDRTRVIVAEIASMMRKKRMKPQEIMPLPQDNRKQQNPQDRWQRFKQAQERMND